MSIAVVKSLVLSGLEAHPIMVEIDIHKGLPSFEKVASLVQSRCALNIAHESPEKCKSRGFPALASNYSIAVANILENDHRSRVPHVPYIAGLAAANPL
ncbi:MAG: hypothetical protein ACM3QZ_05250 [Solirubrobacterales bacterium]